MANATIIEYNRLGEDMRGNPAQIPREPPVAVQSFTFTAVPGLSAAFNANTRFIEIVVDANARHLFGAAPTAGATSPLVGAYDRKIVQVSPGDKVSVRTA